MEQKKLQEANKSVSEQSNFEEADEKIKKGNSQIQPGEQPISDSNY